MFSKYRTHEKSMQTNYMCAARTVYLTDKILVKSFRINEVKIHFVVIKVLLRLENFIAINIDFVTLLIL